VQANDEGGRARPAPGRPGSRPWTSTAVGNPAGGQTTAWPRRHPQRRVCLDQPARGICFGAGMRHVIRAKCAPGNQARASGSPPKVGPTSLVSQPRPNGRAAELVETNRHWCGRRGGNPSPAGLTVRGNRGAASSTATAEPRQAQAPGQQSARAGRRRPRSLQVARRTSGPCPDCGPPRACGAGGGFTPGVR